MLTSTLHLQSKLLKAAKLQESSVQFLRVLLSLYSVVLSRLPCDSAGQWQTLRSITQAGRADSKVPALQKQSPKSAGLV